MTLQLDAPCSHCNGTGFVSCDAGQDEDNCDVCGGNGILITPDGAAIISFLMEHPGIIEQIVYRVLTNPRPAHLR